MKDKYLPLAVLCLCFLTIGACKKKYDNGPIKSEWLLPLLKGDITSAEITNLVQRDYTFSVSGNDFGMNTGTPSSSPSNQTFNNLGPFKISTTDAIDSIFFNHCLIKVKVTNNFPVTIKAGSILSLKNPGNPSALSSYTLQRDIKPNGTDSFNMNLDNKNMGNYLNAYIDKLIIGPYQNIVFNGSLSISMLFTDLSVHKVLVFTDKTWSMHDTTDFDGSNLSIDDQADKIPDSMIHATLTFRAHNQFPAHIHFQAYFLDENGHLIDSLFKPAGHVDGAGYTGRNYASQTNSEFDTYISKSRLEKIKTAVKISYSLDLNSNDYAGTVLKIGNMQSLKIKVIGDINLILSPSFLTSDLF